MKRMFPVLVILFIVIGIPAQALAFVPRGGSVVTISEEIQDDVYAAGQSVMVTAQIDGDLAAAGQDVTVSAPVTGTVMVAGATVDLDNRVGRSVRAAGNLVTLGGPVGTDALLFGATIRITDEAAIGRDLLAAGARIRQAGSVGRNATLYGGRITIAGTIQGNVRVEADELVLRSGARITGRLTYSASQEATIEQGAQISGGIERVPQRAQPRRVVSPSVIYGFRLFQALVEIVWLLVLGFVALAITTRGVRSVAERVGRRFGMSLLAGFVLAVVVPIAAILVCITLVGIPIGVVAILLYLATFYPSKIFVAAWLGDWILARTRGGTNPPSPYLAMLVGVIVLGILIALPIVGWIFRALAIFAGFGALWAKLWEARSGPAPSQTPP